MSEEAKPEVTTEEQPAVTEQPEAATDEQPKTDDQPAVTEVTEVTEQPAAAAEGEAKPAEEKTEEEEPKEKKEEEPKEKPKEEEKKKEPKPKVEKPPPDFRTVKAGWIERPGIFFKSFKRLYMTLDEEGSVLRWWKNNQRTSSDGALYMKFCAEVTEPTEQYTTNWPEGTDERRFVICSPHRAFFILAENADDRNDWIQKLKEAMEKYKDASVKVITTNPMSVESFKGSIGKAADDADTTLKKEGITEEKKTEETPKTEGETAAATTEEPKPEGEAKPEAEVTVDVEVETTATEEPPKAEAEAEKKEEEKPAAEGEGGEEAKAD